MNEDEQQDTSTYAGDTASPGHQLSTAREAKGISLETVSESTGISRKVLEALEANEWDKLDAPVYVRGYLRKYARMLGLDQEALVSSYEASALPRDPELHSYVSEHLPSNRNVRWLLPVTALIIVVVLVLMGLWSWRHFHTSARNVQAPASAVSAMMALTDATPAHATASTGAGLAPPQVTVKQSTASETAAKLHLHMHLDQPSWVEVYGPDNKRLYYNLAAAGANLDFHADKGAFRVFLGNADGVQIEVNGKKFQIPASDFSGQKARFEVDADTGAPSAGTGT
ncbi:MAG TPA: RodZ domain-containing protein [Gammaproteobacteria bacterium]|nr:RodZ domain-containing protein [Gammaproteobacteria bacterium]